jgi:hypothetical protein
LILARGKFDESGARRRRSLDDARHFHDDAELASSSFDTHIVIFRHSWESRDQMKPRSHQLISCQHFDGYSEELNRLWIAWAKRDRASYS